MAHFQVQASSVQRVTARYRPTAEKSEAVAVFMVQQTRDRFSTAGASGDKPWPAPKWTTQIGRPDGRALLTGRTGDLLRSFVGRGDGNTAVLASSDPKSRVHQVGTVGAGGELPDIRPVRAKMLFVPLTDKAAQAYEAAPHVTRSPYGAPRLGRPAWASRLVKGTLKNGQLTPPDADYVLIRGPVKIPPRPMLPSGKNERAAQAEMYLDLSRNQK